MRLIITRHGETVENKALLYSGHRPGKLSDTGIKQAEKLAERLKAEHIDVILSSDLARAADTAEIIKKYHPDAEFHLVKEFREAWLGKYEGKTKDAIDWNNRPDDIESRKDIRIRIKSLFDRIMDKYKDKTVLLVGHHGSVKALLRIIFGKPIDSPIEAQLNTSLSIIDIGEDKNHKVHILNCINHLK